MSANISDPSYNSDHVAQQAEEKGPEAAPKPETGDSGNSHILQTILAGVSIGVAVLYAAGMLITNEYLFTLGFTDFNLIRPKSIITGTWAILAMLSCSGPALSLDRFKDGKITGKRLAEEIVAGFIVAFGLGLIFSSVLVSHWSTRVAVGFLLLPLSLALAPLLYFAVVATLYRGQAKPSYTRHTPVMAFMVISPLIATALIAFFIYPQVHSVLGGGRPLPAKLVLNDEGAKVWRQLSGSTLKGHDSVAADLEILYENEAHIIVRIEHPSADIGSIAIIDKKVVLAVLPGTYSM
jgi:hypothetical protein